MKKLTVFLCLFFLALTLHARAIHEDYRNAEEKARVSYAFGMAIGSNFDLSSMGIEFDYTAFAEGVKAMTEGQPQLSEQEAIEIIETALHNASERRAAQYRLMEEEFLAMNSRRPEVKVTGSGLQYEVIKDAQGEKPQDNSIVRVNYTGTFLDGTLFDDSIEEGGIFIPLEVVLPGWSEGLMLMSIGSQYRLYIPSELAYGSEGIHGIIPPYSTLIFTVELLDIIDGEEDWDY